MKLLNILVLIEELENNYLIFFIILNKSTTFIYSNIFINSDSSIISIIMPISLY